MIRQVDTSLPSLYEADETAWLEAMAEAIEHGRFDDIDYPHLSEYLTDMALRDRREVENRLAVLIAHLLKWMHQPKKRTGSWRATIIEQRLQLEKQVRRGVLRNHAEAVLAEAYDDAIEIAAAETGLDATTFPKECPYSLEQVLSAETVQE